MFKKYWREYPATLQFTLFVLMVFTFFFFVFFVANSLLPFFYSGEALSAVMISKDSNNEAVAVFQWRQFGFQLGAFLLPTLLFVYLTTPHFREYLGLTKKVKPIHLLLSATIMLGAMPVMISLSGLLQLVNFGDEVKVLQQQSDDAFSRLLEMSGTGNFLLTLFLLGIVPAVSEELLFRGMIFRFMSKTKFMALFPAQELIPEEERYLPVHRKKLIAAILVSAAAFTFMHSNIYGLLSIFFAGVLLAYIYYYTGSLWCSMVGHFMNNGFQIILIYFLKGNKKATAIIESNHLPAGIVIAGLAVFAGSFYYLYKTRTPLKRHWANDFHASEVQEEEING